MHSWEGVTNMQGRGAVRHEQGPKGAWLKWQWAMAGDEDPTLTSENSETQSVLCGGNTSFGWRQGD